ncbi:MAG: peptidylprolyl isomerase [Burkholderiales bacterium]
MSMFFSLSHQSHSNLHRLPGCLVAALVCTFALGAVQAQGFKPSGRSPSFSAPGLSAPPLNTPASKAPELPRPGSSAPAQRQQADFIVAVVNSEPITNNELHARVERIAQQLAQSGQPVPPPEILLPQVLDRMISDRAQLQLARESGIKVDPAAVDQAELNVARQNKLTVAELRQRLVSDGYPPDELRDELKRQITLQRLRERELEPKVKVTELDIDQFLNRAQADGAPAELELAQVLIALPEGATAQETAERQRLADQVASRARAGEDFAALAGEFSDGPERATGGRMGLRSADRYPELFVNATKALPAGGVAGPIRSGAGFHVLKVIDKGRLGTPAGMTVMQNHARHILLRLSKQQDEAAARARLADYRRRVESGSGDFAALAREYSQDTSAKDGGDLGWSSPGQYVAEFEQALAGLSPGQLSEPFTTQFGVHLVQLLERREAALTPRQQRELARNVLREKKLDEAYPPWAQDVRNRAFVDMREPPQ